MSEKWPVATRENHDKFCVVEEWSLVWGTAGKPVRHHRTYELPLWDGRILRTRISRPVNGADYPAFMWAKILREQLEVEDASFWACVNDRVLPDRGEPRTELPSRSVSLYLAQALMEFGVTEDEVLSMDNREATERLATLYANSHNGEAERE